MAQGFSGGTQAFSFVSASGQANSSIAVTDSTGAVVASFTPAKSYRTVVVSTAGMVEGDSYSLVIGGTVSGANADGYASASTVSGGATTTFTASNHRCCYGGCGRRGGCGRYGFGRARRHGRRARIAIAGSDGLAHAGPSRFLPKTCRQRGQALRFALP